MNRAQHEEAVRRKKEERTIDTMHIELLVMAMEEFLSPTHPLLHMNHFLHFKKKLARNKAISF
jgi:hypothetical protein